MKIYSYPRIHVHHRSGNKVFVWHVKKLHVLNMLPESRVELINWLPHAYFTSYLTPNPLSYLVLPAGRLQSSFRALAILTCNFSAITNLRYLKKIMKTWSNFSNCSSVVNLCLFNILCSYRMLVNNSFPNSFSYIFVFYRTSVLKWKFVCLLWKNWNKLKYI